MQNSATLESEPLYLGASHNPTTCTRSLHCTAQMHSLHCTVEFNVCTHALCAQHALYCTAVFPVQLHTEDLNCSCVALSGETKDELWRR